jgi:hypothetical protein
MRSFVLFVRNHKVLNFCDLWKQQNSFFYSFLGAET